MTTYILPWQELSSTIMVAKEALSSAHPIIARIDFSAGLWIGKIHYSAGSKEIWPSYNASSMKRVAQDAELQIVLDRMNLVLKQSNCKFVDPNVIVMI